MAFPSFDIAALVAVAVGLFLLFFFRNGRREGFMYSGLAGMERVEGWERVWMGAPALLRNGAIVLFALAFVDPHWERVEEVRGVADEGVAIYLVLDQSGSMKGKMDQVRSVSEEFVRGREGDLVGLVAFARGARVLSPLTGDHAVVLKEIAGLEPVKERGEDGTAIGYAIYKTAQLIGAAREWGGGYRIRDGVIVLVTDGFQDPNPQDYGDKRRAMGVEEAAGVAREEGVRLYVINVDPALGTGRWAAQRDQMRRAARSTGGDYFQVEGEGELEEIYGEIDELEKSAVEGQRVVVERVSAAFYLVAAGLMSLFGWVVGATLVARRVP